MKFLKPQDVGKCERFLMLPFDIFESDLSPKAKLLYAYLLNLSSLSVKNGLHDEKGVYVFCTLETACRILDCGHDKATELFRELECAGLIWRKRTRTAPYIYLLAPEDAQEQQACSQHAEIHHTENQHAEIPQPDCEIPAGRVLENSIGDCDFSATNYTYPNYTDSIHTEEKESDSSISFPNFYPYNEFIDALSTKEQILWSRALKNIGYYDRLPQGEEREKMWKVAWPLYLKLKEEKQV